MSDRETARLRFGGILDRKKAQKLPALIPAFLLLLTLAACGQDEASDRKPEADLITMENAL